MKPKNFKGRKLLRQKRAGLNVVTPRTPRDIKIRLGRKERDNDGQA